LQQKIDPPEPVVYEHQKGGSGVLG